MVELADTPALGAGGRKAVEVQILLPAHHKSKAKSEKCKTTML